MGKTFKDSREEKRNDWKRERQERRKAKKVKRGEYMGKRVERAKEFT